MSPIRIALVGVGKIACDQHMPVLAANPAFELVASVSRRGDVDGLRNFDSLEGMLEAALAVDAICVCTPPRPRYDIARKALASGLHVMLEKPPGATLNEVSALVRLARQSGVALFASWHSREAAGVRPALEWLEGRYVESVAITWKEDVRVWHPGQTWIWEPGGLGVFDPGINALSIITRLLPGEFILEHAELLYPSNCETPIAAELCLHTTTGVPVSMSLDFRQAGEPTWDIDISTRTGAMRLAECGAVLTVDGGAPVRGPNEEYSRLYAHFADLVGAQRIDVDVEPLRLVADAFMCGRRRNVAPFSE